MTWCIMKDYIFGANILENLTTGMYQDSKVIYREYIQNSCDQIDKAIKDGILKPSEGTIKIWLDRELRNITIEDNATGIPAEAFQRSLGNIADSDKKIGEDKGFRGIGRLCGLAYCKELVFTSSSRGEDVVSIMMCDAKKMRGLIEESERGKKHTANEVLQAINRFERKKEKNVDSHFFRVELIDINGENTDLLDFQQVKDYLSFVAPVPYQSSFHYRSKIYKHAKELGTKIDEYTITLDGEPIFKRYTTTLKESNGDKYDDIFDVDFKDFKNENGELFAWMWIGLSKFKKSIPPKANQMRGLRLRKENIQIGGEDSLQKLFKENRGNGYFVGEVFAVDKELIPNSQRDYFNENKARTVFERELRKYCNEELQKIYYAGSAINSAYNKIDSYEKKDAEFKAKETNGAFLDDVHRKRELEVVQESKIKAEVAKDTIEKTKGRADNLTNKVISKIEDERPKSVTLNAGAINTDKPSRQKNNFSKYSPNERKIISKIFRIITVTTDAKTAKQIINKIEEIL
jgi:hypothetical protein